MTEQPAVRLLVGDRVRVTKRTPFTLPGPATVVGIDRSVSRPIRVVLDNAQEPFDVMDVTDDEIEPS